MPWYSTEFTQDVPAVAGGGIMRSYVRDGEDVYLTYDTTDRGTESFAPVFHLLDLTPYGRQEVWEDSGRRRGRRPRGRTACRSPRPRACMSGSRRERRRDRAGRAVACAPTSARAGTTRGHVRTTTAHIDLRTARATMSTTRRCCRNRSRRADGRSRRNARTSLPPTGLRSTSTKTKAAVDAAHTARMSSKKTSPHAPSVNAGHHTIAAMPTMITPTGTSLREPRSPSATDASSTAAR